jgi:hypothetical protein
MPEPTRLWLREFEAAGGVVLDVADAVELGARLRACTVPDLAIAPPSPEVGFVHRLVDETDVYFVANTGAATRRVTLAPRTARRLWQRWDAHTGAVVAGAAAAAPIALELAPYEAALLVLADELPGFEQRDDGPATDARELRGGWTVAFPDAVPQPVALPHDWATSRPYFAGTAVYEHEFDADALWGAQPPTRVALDFGAARASSAAERGERGMRGASFRAEVEPPVREIAVVEVNGVECGVLYAPPYRVDVTSALRAGRNTLRVRVANSTAARLGDPAVRAAIDAAVAESHAVHGARFRMQDLDQATVGLRSGLLAVPVLRWDTGAPRTR